MGGGGDCACGDVEEGLRGEGGVGVYRGGTGIINIFGVENRTWRRS